MKVLYIGSERTEAQAVANALRSVDEGVSVLWAAQLEHAANWLDESRGLDAMVMDAPIDGASCLVVQKHLRRLALPPAVVFIVPDGIAPTLDSLHPGAHYVRRNEDLARDLAIVVTRAVESAARADLEQKLTRATAAREEAEQRHQAAADQLGALQTQYEVGMARANAAWDMVDEQLRTAALEVERARQREEAAAADVARLSRRESELSSQLSDVTSAHRDLERQLADAQAAAQSANARTEQERADAARTLSERQREFDAQLAHAIDERQRVDAQLAHALEERRGVEAELAQAVSAREDAEQRYAAAMTDVARLTTREAELHDQLVAMTASRTDLESRLAATQAAFDDAATRATRERLAASKKAAEREAELEGQIQRERTARTALERDIEAITEARDQAHREYQAAAADVERLTERESDLLAQLAHMGGSRDAVERELSDATAALREANAREAGLADTIEREQNARAALEQRIADTEAALTSALADAHATRETLERELAQLVIERDGLTGRLTETDAALEQARLEHQSAAADVARLTQRESDLTSDLAHAGATRDALDRQLSDTTAALRDAAAIEAALAGQLEEERATRTALEQRLAETESALEQTQRERQSGAAEIERLTQREADLASQIVEAQAARATLERELADAGDTIGQARQDFAAAAAEIDRLTAREADLASQLTDAQAIRSALEQTLTDTRARFVEQRQQLEIQLAQEQLEHESRVADVEEQRQALTRERDALLASMSALQERARQLQDSLTASVEAFEVSRAESHRLFDHAGIAMFRCTREGVLSDVNRALTTLLGRRTYELASADFATAVFEAPQALSWLIERCVSTRAKESIETTWRRQDGSRLFMRLSARSLPSGVIEVVAEDLTRLRVLEERLGQAHRMEALGRLASEVANTCSNLLANIQQQGRAWLATSTVDADSQQRGEQLFDDIGRAAGFLQELAAGGDEQARTPMLVDLNTIVRDLEPVLKSVVGGDVEVQLRDTSTPLNVDVNTERIERLLVNLASYGRGRMPAGGRLRIELGTSVVDRHFSAKHPNVRLGLHALITVTESRRGVREDDAQRQRKRRAARPGVDFATLQNLVSDCGGHLWMKVHPLGEMVAKIRLPLFSAQEQRAPRAMMARAGRERQAAARWFQS